MIDIDETDDTISAIASKDAVDVIRCPFCGGEEMYARMDMIASFFNSEGVYWIECKLCKAIGPIAPNEGEAASKWNTRN